MNSNSTPLSLNSIPDYSYDHNPFLYFEDTLLHGSGDFGYDELWLVMPLQSYSQAPYMEFQSFDDIWGDFAMWDQSFPQVYDVANSDNVVDVKPLISVPVDTAAPVEEERVHQSGAKAFDGNARVHEAPVEPEKFHQNGALSVPGATAFDGHIRIHQATVEEERIHQSGAMTFDGSACIHHAPVEQEKFHQKGALSVPGATTFDGHARIHQTSMDKENFHQNGAMSIPRATAFDGLTNIHQSVEEEIFPQSGTKSVCGATSFDGHTHIHQTSVEKERLHQSGAIIVHGDMAFDGYTRIHQTLVEKERLVVHGNMAFDGHSRIHQTPTEEERFHQGGAIRYSTKSTELLYEEIRKYFDVPISTAAKELKVGVTVLKKRCRELNIRRWPHRKIKSLTFLIQNAKDLGLTSEVATLEAHKRMIHKIPELELSERTKKLRQACFKANYKKRRALGMAAAYQNY